MEHSTGVSPRGRQHGEAEQAPNTREDDLALLFSSMTSGFCLGRVIRDKSGRAVDVFFEMTNDAFERMENLASGPLRGRRLFEADPDADNLYFDIYADVATNRRKTSFRKLIPSTGATLDVVCYSPKEDCFACVQNDISERVAAERKLQRAYTDTEAILHEIPAPICVVSRENGLILDCNAAFISICSPNHAHHLMGSHITGYLRNVEGGGTIPDRLNTGASFICKLRRIGGVTIDVEVFSRSFVYTGQPAFVLYCVDLTQQKAHEQALRDAADAAEEASRMKSNFLANMSHEIRTPMNGVIGFAELALDDPDIRDSTRDYLNKINISANGLLEIINNVLDLSKIEAGKVDLEKKSFSLHEIFKHCEAIISPKAREKGLQLYFYSEPHLARTLIGDPTRLRQILLNLLSNSVKFTNYGMVKMMAVIDGEQDDRIAIRFEVKDSGIGMTPEQLERVFVSFMQADSGTTRKYGGTGLGLVITKNLIEMMGGELHVDSAPGIGSRFSFILSFDTASVAPDEDFSGESRREAVKKPVFSGEALVFEDNIVNQQVVAEHLKRVGINSVIAPDGRQGVEIAERRMADGKPFDIILMDIHMPVMDGLEAAARLISLGVKTPIVAMTANVMTSDRKLYETAGMSDYLGKPFTSGDLWACLLRHLTPVAMTSRLPASEKPDARPGSDAVRAVDRSLGLVNAAGDESFYRRLLTLFVRTNEDAPDHLRKAIDSGDLELARRTAHTLKTVSGTIGAAALSKRALALEAALSADPPAHTPELLDELERELKAVLRELEPFGKGNAGPPREMGGPGREEPSELISRLEPLLRSGDSESLELVDSIRSSLSFAGESCDKLVALIEDYEFELALEVLERIRSIPEVPA